MSRLRCRLLVLWEERHPLFELRRASSPGPTPVCGGMPSGSHGPGKAVSALPFRLPRVPPSGIVHRCGITLSAGV